MIKRHILFLFFQLKSVLKILPRLLVATLIFSVIVVAAAFCGNKMINENQTSIAHIKVAVELPDNDKNALLGFQMISNMESVSNVCSFILTSEEEAYELLQKGIVFAAVIIPDGFVDSVMNGTNLPAYIVLPKNCGLETMFFCHVLEAGGHSLAYSQAGIYAVDDLLWAHNMDYQIDDAEDYLNDTFLQYTINREFFFSQKEISATGDVSSVEFYTCSAIMFIFLLCTMVVTDRFSKRNQAVITAYKINRFSPTFIATGEYISITVMLFLFISLILTAYESFSQGMLTISLAKSGGLLCFCVSVSAFIMFICSCFEDSMISALVIFLSSSIMMYACGRIVPGPNLPKAIEQAGLFLPLNKWNMLLEEILFTGITSRTILSCLTLGLIFYTLGIILSALRGRYAQ